MDPWANEGESGDPQSTAGASWSPSVPVQDTPTSPVSPIKFQDPTSALDPWATNEPSEEPSQPSTHASLPHESSPRASTYAVQESTEIDDGHALGSRDFDPWGGGVPPSAPLDSRSHYAATTEIDDADSERNTRDDHAYVGASRASLGLERGDAEIEAGHSEEVKADEPPSQAFDEDDPWGSGAQARRIKAQNEAEAAAQQMEILRLQEEAKGEVRDETEALGNDGDDASSSKGEAQTKDDKNDATPAATTGWRSFFNRSAAKAPDAAQTTSETKAAEEQAKGQIAEAKSSGAPSAPRLWQAPSLRVGHYRTSSDASQGSAAKNESSPATPVSGHPSNPASKGPGWEVTTKKQTSAAGGGFLSNFLAQPKDSSSGSSLSRFGQSLQRPPVVSASDADHEPDDSGDFEDTGLEWDAGNQFDQANSAKKPQKGGPAIDLLNDDQQPQESAVSRFIGKWRGKQPAPTGAMSGDDLSWLENMGNSDPKGQVDGSQQGSNAQQVDDWLAFVESKETKSDEKAVSTKTVIPKFDGKITIPNLNKKPVQQPLSGTLPQPPRLSAPPQRTQQVDSSFKDDPSSLLEAENSHEPFSNYRHASGQSSYRDEPDSHDDFLIRRGHGDAEQKPHPKRQTSFLSSITGRPVKPYTFDDDEDEGHRDDSWSAFKDVPFAAQQNAPARSSANNNVSGRPSPLEKPVGLPSPQARTKEELQRTSSPVATPNTGGRGAFLPPPPPPASSSSLRTSTPTGGQLPAPPRQSVTSPTPSVTSPTSAPSLPKANTAKTLSEGHALTNDDLDFFENL